MSTERYPYLTDAGEDVWTEGLTETALAQFVPPNGTLEHLGEHDGTEHAGTPTFYGMDAVSVAHPEAHAAPSLETNDPGTHALYDVADVLHASKVQRLVPVRIVAPPIMVAKSVTLAAATPQQIGFRESRKRRMQIIASGATLVISNNASDLTDGAQIPAGIPVTLENCDDVWVTFPTTGGTVSWITEVWEGNI